MKRFNQLRAVLMSLALLVAVGIVALPARTQAASATACTSDTSGFLGLPTWYKFLKPQFNQTTKECILMPDASDPSVSTFNPLKDSPKILLAIFEIILRIGGIVAVGFVIYGGIQYILTQGEPDKAKAARGTILNAIIGLVITLVAVAIVNVIGKNI